MLMLVHLLLEIIPPAVYIGHRPQAQAGAKTDRRDGATIRVPIKVLCSIFNVVPPIRDWWVSMIDGHLNDSHWLLRTQAWTISTKEWDVGVFFQWSIAWHVREKIGVDKCRGSLHSRNASLDRGGTMWGRDRIGPNTTKRRILRINSNFWWHFIIVDVEQIVHFTQ